MSPGWQVTDFAVVGADPARPRATMTCCSGTSELDGPVDVIVVAEEAGTGLGARIAGTLHDDPGADLGERPAGGEGAGRHPGGQPLAGLDQCLVGGVGPVGRRR